jgi:AcrR family transcriptional regulator
MNTASQAPTEIEQRLLPVVEELLFQHGFSGLNIREVSRAVEMGPATIYKYFGSKEGLALRVLQDQDRQVAMAIAPHIPESASAHTKWKAFYRALLSFYDKHPKIAVIQNIAMPTHTWFLPEEKWPVTAVARVIRRLIKEGRATGELDPAVTDNQIMAAHYMHFVREVRLWRSRDMGWRLADRVDTFFPVVWKTISAPGAPSGPP